MNFGNLHSVAFFVSRHVDARALPFILSGQASAVGVRTGFPNYVEVGVEVDASSPSRPIGGRRRG